MRLAARSVCVRRVSMVAQVQVCVIPSTPPEAAFFPNLSDSIKFSKFLVVPV